MLEFPEPHLQRFALLGGIHARCTANNGECPLHGARPEAGGWNRVHLIVDDLPGEIARLRAAGAQFRNDIMTGPGGSQILLSDPSGNLVELFQPGRRQ
jgi:predicted enzyme related to lactoylglutathione lyase